MELQEKIETEDKERRKEGRYISKLNELRLPHPITNHYSLPIVLASR